MRIACIIPARYGSTRLPGKPLAMIGNKPMIQRVYEQVSKATEIHEVIVATDDERLIDASVIDALARQFKEEPTLQMGTVGCPLLEEEYNEPSAVKVIVNRLGNAMYFSRSLIPYPRHAFIVPPLKHVGMYGYNRQFLLTYAKMEPTPAELTESLEQLRALENGYTIRVIATNQRFVGVDTPEDLERVNEIFYQLEA